MKRPILIIAIGYIIGILGGLYLKKSIVLFLLFIAIILSRIKIKKLWKVRRYKRYIKLYINNKELIILIIAVITSFICVCFQEKEYQKTQKILLENENITIIGKVEKAETSKQYGKIYTVKIKSIIKNKKEIQISKKKIYIQTQNNNLQIKYGDIIQTAGKFEEPESRRNYKGFDYKLYLKTKSIVGNLKSNNIKKIANKIENPIEYIEYKSINLSNKLKENANKILPKDISSVFIGLVLGDTSEISEETIENFRNTNMSHILAVSGMHMSYLILLSIQIFGKILGKKQAYITSTILIIFYMFLTGFSASIIRSGVMGIILIISKIIYKNNDIFTNIAISSLIISIKNPYSILDLSFQFSFGGTIGIVLFQKFISKKFLEKILRSKKIIEILSVTISAQIVILPISIFQFNTLNIYFVLSNLIIGFIIGPVMACSFIFLICLIVNVKLANIISFPLEICIKIIILISKISKLPYSQIYLATPKILEIILYFLLINASFFIYYIYTTKKITPTVKRIKNIIAMIKFYIKYRIEKRTKIVIKRVIAFGIILIIIIQLIPKNFKIHFLDVKQGDSTFIVTPRGKTILIDGGGSSYSNIGKNTLLPYILDRGYTKIDIAIISHMDLDHCDGIIYLMEKIKINTVILGNQYERTSNYERFIKIAKERKINLKRVEEGDKINIEKDVNIEVLWPNSKKVISENIINNNSLVFKINYKKFSILFTGDIEEIAEKKILEENKNTLKSTILKVAHHGSKTSTTSEFLKAVNPQYALIGVGKNNKFGHPSENTLKKMKERNIRVYRTDELGEITIKLNKNINIVHN